MHLILKITMQCARGRQYHVRNTQYHTCHSVYIPGYTCQQCSVLGRRPFDFELDVETRDAEQNNTETGSQNRTRAEQETKHDQAQDRTQTEKAPATRARRTRQTRPVGTGRKPDTSFPVYIFLGRSGSWVGALSLWLGFGVGALRLVCSETPTQHFVICAANALPTLRSVLGSAPFGERVRRELSEHLPSLRELTPPPLRGCLGCRGFKTLSTMLLASRSEISAQAAFAEGPNLDMIGIMAARYSMICICCHRSNNKFAWLPPLCR